jgi:hypothetical protein
LNRYNFTSHPLLLVRNVGSVVTLKFSWCIDEIVFRPIFHSKRDEEKNYKFYGLLFNISLMIKHIFSNIKIFNLRFLKRGVVIHINKTTSVSSLASSTDLDKLN